MIRGLAKKILILVPASLVSQWVKELQEKFLIPAVEQKKSYVWEQCDIVVSSIDTAKRSPHKDIVLSIPYDLVIIDEAHKLKNSKTKNYEFAKSCEEILPASDGDADSKPDRRNLQFSVTVKARPFRKRKRISRNLQSEGRD